jgi:hypothetical protein
MAEEEVEQKQLGDVLSDTGLFYLYYANDSGLRTALEAGKGLSDAFFASMREAEAARNAEYGATLALQASTRRLFQRRQYSFWRARAIAIERAQILKSSLHSVAVYRKYTLTCSNSDL